MDQWSGNRKVAEFANGSEVRGWIWITGPEQLDHWAGASSHDSGETGFDAFAIAALMVHNVRTTQRYVRATERKRETVQAAMLSSRGHNLGAVNAITRNSAVA